MKWAWRASCAAVALLAAGLIAAYSIVTPAFETPDEPGHFRYVQQLAGGAGLPVQGKDGDLDPEFSQPPLYYAVQAGLARLIPEQGQRVPDFDHHNPYQNATALGNVNLYAHTGETFPWSGQLLRLHAMRLLNLLFAAGILLAVFGIARELGLSRWPALASAATLGLLPQFDFIAGALNADNAVAAASADALYLLLRWLQRPPGPRLAGVLGLAVAAALLSKLSGAAVLGVVLAAMLWRAAADRKPAAAFDAAVVAAIAMAGAGWWYVRNLFLYGDLLGWQPMLAAIGAMRRPEPLSPFGAAAQLLGQRATALGVFGWNNLRLPEPVYLAADAVALLAAIGLLACLVPPRWDKARVRGPALLAAWAALFAASLVRWVEVNTDAAQWRLLLPAFPALAVLAVIGLARLWRGLAALLPVSLAGLSLASLGLVIHPAYTPDAAYAGPIQHQVGARFGDRLELAGYDDPQPRNPAPGQPVALTLYWRVLQPLDQDDVVDLAALDVDGRQGLKETTWPEYGRAPTAGWTPGAVVRDRHVLAGAGSLAPGAWQLMLDVFQPLEGAPRLPLASGGTTLNVGRFLVPAQPAVPSAPAASFDGGLDLVGHAEAFDPAGALAVNLTWRATAPPARDYTVFVHLLDSSGKLAAQDDSQPAAGRFPTSLLPAGGAVPNDLHKLDVASLPAGGYRVEAGLYDSQTGVRLKLRGSQADAVEWPLRLD